MAFFDKSKDQVIGLLTAQLHDMTAMVERLQTAHAAQVKELTDKIMAMANPMAVRVLQPPVDHERRLLVPPRSNLPGWRPDTRPANPQPPRDPLVKNAPAREPVVIPPSEKAN